jgi:hypothetical protein
MLLERQSVYKKATESLAKAVAESGIKMFKSVATFANDALKEGLRQANDYETEIVGAYGDISTQQEEFGKSMAKLAFERTQEYRQDFLQMEAGGIRLVDVYRDAEAAAQDTFEIIGGLAGASAQFQEDLQGQNLEVVKLLKMAAGLTSDQTTAIMKIAKARREDSKQMLADISTFSKIVADKFGLDTKRITRSVVEMTTNTSTFGKVSIEAATAAAAKFESLGVTVDDVANSIGQSFGSFSGAADAAAKMSQVFGVNIDAMQMMIDVNSGPDGMMNALDSMRESLIGAGVDASELSAPMRRLIKDMTGVRDDATIESLFDPDRIGIESKQIVDAAAKAAEAQKGPTDAIKFMDRDIARVHRSMSDLSDLIDKQTMARIGVQATESAKSLSQMNSSLAKTIDSMNQLVASTDKLPVKKALDTAFGGTTAAAEAGRVGSESLDKMITATATAEGIDIAASTPVDYGKNQVAGRGSWQDTLFQNITGYVPPKSALDKANYRTALEDMSTLVLKLAYERQQGIDTAATAAAISAQKDRLVAAASMYGLDQSAIDSAIATVSGQQAASAEAAQPLPSTVPLGAEASPTPSPTAVAPITPVATVPQIAPVGVSSSGQPAAAPVSAPTPAAGAARSSASVSSPVRATSPAGDTTVGTAVASVAGAGSVQPVINISVTLDAGATGTTLAKYSGLAIV